MDSQVQRLIDLLQAATPPGTPRLWELSPRDARKQADAFMAPFNQGGPAMAEIRAIEINGTGGPIAGRIYVPPGVGATSPGLLYFHGGGFVICNLDTHDRLVRELAEGIRVRVVAVDYALAPEHPFPAGLNDCVDAARWLAEHGKACGIDPTRLLIGGDSAGANLVAATVSRLDAEGGGPQFRGALLFYGRYAAEETPSIKAWGARDLILSRNVMDWFRAHYLVAGGDPAHPYIAPLNGALHAFPPAILIAGTLDPLLSDSELFAAALRKAGVQAELHVFQDAPHAFLQMPMLDVARDALGRACRFAQRQLT